MSNVVGLKGESAGLEVTCEDVAAMCDRVAAMARDGRVVSAAISFVYADGGFGTLWESKGHMLKQIGATAVMQAGMAGGAK